MTKYNNVHKDNKGRKGDSLVRCMLFRPGEEPKIVWASPRKESWKFFVDGHTQVLPMNAIVEDGLNLILNESGFVYGIDADDDVPARLKPNCRLYCKDTEIEYGRIFGSFVIVSLRDGAHASLDDNEIDMIKYAYQKTIKPIK